MADVDPPTVPRVDLVECPLPGCTNTHLAVYAMCGVHWARVPPGLRTDLWVAHRGRPGSPKHLALLAAAYTAAGRPRG